MQVNMEPAPLLGNPLLALLTAFISAPAGQAQGPTLVDLRTPASALPTWVAPVALGGIALAVGVVIFSKRKRRS